MNNTNLIRHEDKGVVYYTSPLLDNLTWLKHGMATRIGGVSTGPCESMNLSKAEETPDSKENVRENYIRFFSAVGIAPERVVSQYQVHGKAVSVVPVDHSCNGIKPGVDFPDNDGMVTDGQGLALFGYTADCTIVMFADDRQHVVGICHAGWKGTVQKIAVETIEKMKEAFGSRPEDIYAFIAPSICQDCFEVGAEVIEAVNKIIPEDKRDGIYYGKDNGKYQLSLWECNKYLIMEAEVPEEHIELPNLCSRCNPDLFFSHRLQGAERGTGGAFIMIK